MTNAFDPSADLDPEQLQNLGSMALDAFRRKGKGKGKGGGQRYGKCKGNKSGGGQARKCQELPPGSINTLANLTTCSALCIV